MAQASYVLHGICFLIENGLSHRVFSCKCITLGLDGIACLEDCLEAPSTEAETVYIATLPSITMQLMQKYEKEEGVIGIDDLDRWPVDSEAFAFLSATVSTRSIASLQKNVLVSNRHEPRKLVVLARLVLIDTQILCIHE
ncbi:uncharacterized protein N7482_007986 [Penicillium canariense]|uniref:Uncharacterized protein n=1 Tax=Penicillium canariense TaxID=189055 RepID=A0A9W9LJP5_9EURO|nr:uncharacterized protein N7482_007986 [Penicillium canariense]KAJ5160982.1 hypothetical protein N7482_007986 [Penicillium canariense]